MHRFLSVLSIITLSLAVSTPVHGQSLPTAKPEEVGMSSERLQRLSRVMQAYVDEGKLVGATALVARRGKIAYLKSFGQRDLEAGEPMKNDTIFRIASQTKALVSAGVMMLQEEGKLLISDPVGKYLPEYMETSVAVPREGGGYDVIKARRPITIRDLLTHTAGIGYGGGPGAAAWKSADIQGWYFAHRDEPVGVTVAHMASLPMDAQPGEKFVYGYNTDILGAMIEKVSGKSLDVFLQERILKPLGMKDTHFYLPMNKKDRLAVVYSVNEEGQVERAPAPGGMVGQGAYVEGPRKSFSGGAGLLSTAADYAAFMQAMLNGGTLNGKRILSRKTVELMTANHIQDIDFWTPGAGFGLGFQVTEDIGARGVPGSPGEFGWGGAYHSTYWADPKEDLIVVYFTQLIPTGGLDDQSKLRALVYQAIVD